MMWRDLFVLCVLGLAISHWTNKCASLHFCKTY